MKNKSVTFSMPDGSWYHTDDGKPLSDKACESLIPILKVSRELARKALAETKKIKSS